MIRLRRAAPSILGTLIVVLGLGMTLAAEAQGSQAVTWDSALDKLGPVLAVVGAIVGAAKGAKAAVRSVADSAITKHEDDEHRPLDRAVAELLTEVRSLRRDLAPLAGLDERLRALEEDHAAFHGRRDPNASPHRCRVTGRDGEDHTGERGR